MRSSARAALKTDRVGLHSWFPYIPAVHAAASPPNSGLARLRCRLCIAPSTAPGPTGRARSLHALGAHGAAPPRYVARCSERKYGPVPIFSLLLPWLDGSQAPCHTPIPTIPFFGYNRGQAWYSGCAVPWHLHLTHTVLICPHLPPLTPHRTPLSLSQRVQSYRGYCILLNLLLLNV